MTSWVCLSFQCMCCYDILRMCLLGDQHLCARLVPNLRRGQSIKTEQSLSPLHLLPSLCRSVRTRGRCSPVPRACPASSGPVPTTHLAPLLSFPQTVSLSEQADCSRTAGILIPRVNAVGSRPLLYGLQSVSFGRMPCVGRHSDCFQHPIIPWLLTVGEA